MMCVVANMPTNTQVKSMSPGCSADKEPNNNTDNERPNEPASEASDDFGSTDEVKVFNDEDERDGDASESYQAELQAEKSSLIHESEQTKTSTGSSGLDKDLIFRHEELAPASALVPGMAGFPSYFVNPYAAYANGSAHVARSSTSSPLSGYLYQGNQASNPNGQPDVGSPPPPAHVGLRSPLYSLPHTQYPYSMLGAADQLAAWHHQASVYHQASGALRSTSPYSLPPITSATFSTFSPSSLLASGHQPAVGHLPHIKGDFDTSSPAIGHRKESRQNKKKETHIKKPLNAFMLYMKEMRPVVQAECTLKESAAINQLLGRRWHGLSREEQAKYYEKARVERQKHMQMYPHWNARDNYRFGVKKKKRKREKSIEANSSSGGGGGNNGLNNSMKKCRARYGLDQHNLWCKPCSPTEDNEMNEATANDLNLLASLPQAPIPPHEFLAECYVDPAQLQPHQPPNSLEDVELVKDHQHVYSPEYISLRKKKCIRVQALQRHHPNQHQPDNQDEEDSSAKSEAASPLGLSSPEAAALNPSPWLSLMSAGSYGAFKPPTPSYSRSHDPRDAKHPLSICQLTSKSAESSSSSSLAAAICAASAVANSAALLGLR